MGLFFMWAALVLALAASISYIRKDPYMSLIQLGVALVNFGYILKAVK